jgi:asparagine synthase (glutamine-hydrolysing)
MCGICGEVFCDWPRHGDASLVGAMASAMVHRGPDSHGTAVGAGFGLGATRLAVIDLTPDASQPFTNEDGSIHLVFNGEIYNFAELRRRLEKGGHEFRSRCDAECVVHLYEEKGPACLDDLRGMFAFAIHDAREGVLFAARDRVGKKPLFYRMAPDGSLVFASEIKALLRHPAVRAEPDWHALGEYAALGYVPGESTAFRGIRRLPPAHYMLWKEGRLAVRRYWRLEREPCLNPEEFGGEEGLARELLRRIEEAVAARLVSDAPLGVLLSGGIDSSCVAALAARSSGAPLRTFSIGFEEKEYDELPHAERVAALLGTQHTYRRARPDAAALLPDIVRHVEEPFADSSALATWLAAELAAGVVTVVLNGDGGDESFAGYDRYAAHALAGKLEVLPARLSADAAQALLAMVPARGGGRSVANRLRRFLAHCAEPPVERYFSWMSCLGADDMRRLLTADFLERAGWGPANMGEPPAIHRFRSAWHAADLQSDLNRLLDVDLRTYLPGDLLVKMDRCCMAWSVEARSPLLDHELMEFAARIPPGLKLRGLFDGKHILKRALEDVLPPGVLGRRKAGFGVPIDRWLRGPLQGFAHDVLLGSAARARGIIRPGAVATLLDEHAAGRRVAHHAIWSLLVLELWFREFVDG